MQDSVRVISKLQVISMNNFVVNLDLDASSEMEGMGSNDVFLWITGEPNWVRD